MTFKKLIITNAIVLALTACGGGGSNNIDRSNVEPIIPNHPQDQTNNVSTSTDTTQKDELKKTQDRLTETSSSLKKAQEELKRKTAEFKALKDAQATTEKQLTDASNSLEQIQSDLKEKERVFEELQRQNQLKLQELSETHQKLTEREQLIEIINQKMSDTVESMGATLDNPWLWSGN